MESPPIKIINDALSAYGYTLGQNLELRSYGADAHIGRLPQLAKEIAAAGADAVAPTAYFLSDKALKQRRTNMLMLDRRMLLRAGSAAVGAAALAPTAPALAHAPQASERAQPKLLPLQARHHRDYRRQRRLRRIPGRNAVGRSGRGRRRPSHIDVPAAEHRRSSRGARCSCSSTPSSSIPATSWC